METLRAEASAPFIACAFYTDGYAAEAAQLEKSLAATDTPHFIRRYDSRGFWEANTRIKPEFLRDCLARFPDRDIVYLDADAVVRSRMELFYDFAGDLGVFHAPSEGGYSHRYLTGTLYLRNAPAVRAFVERWIAAQAGSVLAVDQDSFEAALGEPGELDIRPLPASYVKIFDRGSETAVIEHFQASRKRVKLQRTLKRARNTLLAITLLALVAWLVFA